MKIQDLERDPVRKQCVCTGVKDLSLWVLSHVSILNQVSAAICKSLHTHPKKKPQKNLHENCSAFLCDFFLINTFLFAVLTNVHIFASVFLNIMHFNVIFTNVAMFEHS